MGCCPFIFLDAKLLIRIKTRKNIFKNALQEMLEAELEIELRYSKGDRKSKKTDNRRNGYSPKTVKTQFREMVNLSK